MKFQGAVDCRTGVAGPAACGAHEHSKARRTGIPQEDARDRCSRRSLFLKFVLCKGPRIRGKSVDARWRCGSTNPRGHHGLTARRQQPPQCSDPVVTNEGGLEVHPEVDPDSFALIRTGDAEIQDQLAVYLPIRSMKTLPTQGKKSARFCLTLPAVDTSRTMGIEERTVKAYEANASMRCMGQSDADKDKSKEMWNNMAMIGFAIAAGESPNALQNIAERYACRNGSDDERRQGF